MRHTAPVVVHPQAFLTRRAGPRGRAGAAGLVTICRAGGDSTRERVRSPLEGISSLKSVLGVLAQRFLGLCVKGVGPGVGLQGGAFLLQDEKKNVWFTFSVIPRQSLPAAATSEMLVRAAIITQTAA